MPRIRTLKPEFFRSPDTARVDFPVRLFYQALWCWADDFGVGETNINGLLGFAFPDEDPMYDPELRDFRAISAQDVRRFCADVAQHYGVVFFVVRGRHYYWLPTWDQHQKTERREDRRKNPRHDDPDSTPDLRFQPRANFAPETPRKIRAESRETGAGTGEQGNRGTGEEDDDARDRAAAAVVVDVEPPEHIDNPSRPAKRYASSASKTLVRHTLGANTYPRDTVDRLAVQVDKMLAADHPEPLVREAVAEWDRRPNCDRPEYLPTVLSDVIKRSRAAPTGTTHKMRAWAELAAEERAREEHAATTREEHAATTRKELAQ